MEHFDKEPVYGLEVYIDPRSVVTGDVVIGSGSSVWPGAVLRGDSGKIIIGKNSNIQDNCTVHMTTGIDTVVGDNVTVGHNAVLHGCELGNNVLIGMGAIVLDGAMIGDNSLVGAGSLVTPGKKFAPGSMIIGSPARAIRTLSEEDIDHIRKSSRSYVSLAGKMMEKNK